MTKEVKSVNTKITRCLICEYVGHPLRFSVDKKDICVRCRLHMPDVGTANRTLAWKWWNDTKGEDPIPASQRFNSRRLHKQYSLYKDKGGK